MKLNKSLILAVPVALCLIVNSNAYADNNYRQKSNLRIEHRIIKPKRLTITQNFQHKKFANQHNYRNHIQHCKASKHIRNWRF
jgi:hypothetical protein